MRRTIAAIALSGVLLLSGSSVVIAGGQEHGQGHGHNKQDDHDAGKHGHGKNYYEPEVMWGWYDEHRTNLPPGLAKKDRLPPGLEKQLVVKGSLPPGLQKKMYPCPPDLEKRLPPPPPDCIHTIIGGSVVLLNRRTNVVLEVFYFGS